MAESILSSTEIEHIVEHFQVSKIYDIGNLQWFSSRDKLCKVYQVAILEVKSEGSERIEEFLSIYNRLKDFVRELITLGIWREKIFPELLSLSPGPEHSLPTYLVLYSEFMLGGILEAVLFHERMFWDLGEIGLDLIDYAVTQLTNINPKSVYKMDKVPNLDPIKEINKYNDFISLNIAITCITILRYIVENFDKMSLSAASKIYSDHDLPLIVSHMLDKEIWSYRKDGKLYKYDKDHWQEHLSEDPILNSVECQTWLLMRQLLINSTCDTVYYYSNYRKERLSKLTRLLHDAVIDQMSPLADLKLWLHRISISSAGNEKFSNPLIIEMSCGFRNELLGEFEGRWSKIAQGQAGIMLYPQHDELVNIARGFASGIDSMELVEENMKTCNLCFAKACKRCSKCQNAWYCSRKCQVNHWNSHKEVCCKNFKNV